MTKQDTCPGGLRDSHCKAPSCREGRKYFQRQASKHRLEQGLGLVVRISYENDISRKLEMVAGPGTTVISRHVGSRAKQTSMAKTEENWGLPKACAC